MGCASGRASSSDSEWFHYPASIAYAVEPESDEAPAIRALLRITDDPLPVNPAVANVRRLLRFAADAAGTSPSPPAAAASPALPVSSRNASKLGLACQVPVSLPWRIVVSCIFARPLMTRACSGCRGVSDPLRRMLCAGRKRTRSFCCLMGCWVGLLPTPCCLAVVHPCPGVERAASLSSLQTFAEPWTFATRAKKERLQGSACKAPVCLKARDLATDRLESRRAPMAISFSLRRRSAFVSLTSGVGACVCLSARFV